MAKKAKKTTEKVVEEPVEETVEESVKEKKEEETEEVWKMGQGAPVEVPKEKKGDPEPKSLTYGA